MAIPSPFSPGPRNDAFLIGDPVAAHPRLVQTLVRDARSSRAVDVIEALCAICEAHGLALILDISIDRVDAKGQLALHNPAIFRPARSEILNPKSGVVAGVASAYVEESELANRFTALWAGCLGALLTIGVRGFRFRNPGNLPPKVWRLLNAILRAPFPRTIALAATPGMAWQKIEMLADCGFDGVSSSLPWWDCRAQWFAEELNVLRAVAPVITGPGFFSPHDRKRHDNTMNVSRRRQMLQIAAATGDALFVPCDARTLSNRDDYLGIRTEICTLINQFAQIQRCGTRGVTRAFGSLGDAVTSIIRYDNADVARSEKALITIINSNLQSRKDLVLPLDPVTSPFDATFGHPVRLFGSHPVTTPLEPGEVRVVKVERLAPANIPENDSRSALADALKAPRVVIEAITPSVNDGAFPARAVIGDRVDVAADIFADGHFVLAAELLWQCEGEANWHRAPMSLVENDRWSGCFTPAGIGVHYFAIEAWVDEFGSHLRDIELKRIANSDVTLDLTEAFQFIEIAAVSAKGTQKAALATLLGRLAGASHDIAVQLLGSAEVKSLMSAAQPRRFATRAKPLALNVERARAGFAAWYELFPRSCGDTPAQHGTFDDVVRRLPDIKMMGFDVLYLTPIHPIGHTNRKGRNNALAPAPDDPGSPYAIGGIDGGHDAIHPQLGSLEDFRRLIAAAADHDLEIALDFAVQCSPDHPWLKEHPNWFRRRADGSVRYAENPPKKYEDIVNVDFYAASGADQLWVALRDVVLFWIEQGIKIFRVDNPHTKPLPFWEWMIADVRARHPDAIFLSEAFTRPKMMYRLAKIGFSQSYTYFTWRNTKREITDYLTELTTPPLVDFFRPHFFVNTPDINPLFLQQGGRAGFLIRAVLAATLSGLWGIYSGFELCEAAALPGKEEYLDSEKYEIKRRDYDAPGNIKAEIAALNRIRKAHRALHSHRGIKFYNAFDDHVIAFGKTLPTHEDMIFVVVNLDPHNAREATFEVPLWEWGMDDHGSLKVEDLIHDGTSFVWNGKLQHVRLEPFRLPYAIWRISPLAGETA